MKKIFFISSLIIILFSSCKKDEVPTNGELISNWSFEQDGSFTTDGWVVNNTTSSTDVPTVGGKYSLQISPAIDPEEGYAEYTIENLEGTKTYLLTCYIKSFDNLTGTVALRKVSSAGDVTVLGLQASNENDWIQETINATTSFNSGDKLVVHLSGGTTEIPAASKYALFDNVKLFEQ